MDTTCNGWTNYQTWVVNLHIGDYLQECVNTWEPDGKHSTRYECGQYLKQCFEELYGEELSAMDSLLSALLTEDKIDWYDLAETYLKNVEVSE